MDDGGIRLPDQWSAQDRKTLRPSCSSPASICPAPKIPQPSEPWSTDDYAAAAKLANLLSPQPFARQIASIDMTNFRGRKDALKPWITLKTIFTSGRTRRSRRPGSPHRRRPVAGPLGPPHRRRKILRSPLRFQSPHLERHLPPLQPHRRRPRLRRHPH